MHTRTGLQFIVLGAATLLLWSASTSRASACKCRPSTVESSYNTKSDVFIATIAGNLVLGDTRYYIGQVDTTYKGCLLAGELVLLETPASSATCGAQLGGSKHLINANAADRRFGVSLLSIDSCSYNVEASALTDHDRAFLDGRYVCCGDDCACADGSQPVACFVDPCQVAHSCDAGECRSNYCGGCNAEFFDEGGYPVCSVGGRCESDEDCGDEAWCRETASDDSEAEPSLECVPLAGEGAPCNRDTQSSDYLPCEPGLVCDTWRSIVDPAGICRRGCSESSDCNDDEYCSALGLCAINGSCAQPVDCNLGDNEYYRPQCLGYGACNRTNQCRWRCGNPKCADLAGYDFGSCEEVLGWARIYGSCLQLGGCSGHFELFETEEECETSC